MLTDRIKSEFEILYKLADTLSFGYFVADSELEDKVCGEIMNEGERREIKVVEFDLKTETEKYVQSALGFFDYVSMHTSEEPSITLIRGLRHFRTELPNYPNFRDYDGERPLAYNIINLQRENVRLRRGLLLFIFDEEIYQEMLRHTPNFSSWKSITCNVA